MVKTIVNKYIPYTILPVAVFSVSQFTPFPLGNTIIWWLVFFAILVIFFWEARFSFIRREDKRAILVVKLYLAWNILCIARGIFAAENYWHYKFLIGNGLGLLLPVLVYIALNNQLVLDILSFYVRIALPVALFIFPFLGLGAWGWYMYPVTLLMLFYPSLPLKGKILGILISLVCILGDLTARSHVIKFSLPIILLLIFYSSRHFIVITKILETGRLILFVVPFVLFALAVTNTFNVFRMNEYIEGEYKVEKEDAMYYETNLTHDTRTFLYEEVIATAIKYNSWLFGRTPARGNETIWFEKEMIEFYGQPERPKNEVSILNVFTWTGIVGVVLLLFVFFKASFLAINRSNNIYAKILGFLIASRWMYAWVEDVQDFNANTFTLWLMIGLCFSSSFREMTNFEIKIWLLGIFKKEYNWIYKLYLNQKSLHKV